MVKPSEAGGLQWVTERLAVEGLIEDLVTIVNGCRLQQTLHS